MRSRHFGGQKTSKNRKTEVATDLFGTWDAVNGTIIIVDGVYKVVGVLEEQGSSLVGSDDSRILIPYSIASRMICAVIGVLFGGYPADKASQLQPIDALHTL